MSPIGKIRCSIDTLDEVTNLDDFCRIFSQKPSYVAPNICVKPCCFYYQFRKDIRIFSGTAERHDFCQALPTYSTLQIISLIIICVCYFAILGRKYETMPVKYVYSISVLVVFLGFFLFCFFFLLFLFGIGKQFLDLASDNGAEEGRA